MRRQVRILVCGSLDGGDDAAAIAAVALLPAPARERASVEEVLQLSAEQLLGDAPGTRRVVVDCVRGLAPGQVVDLPLAELPALERRLGTASTHALGLGQVVALAAALGAVGAEDRFIGIGGANFVQGDALSRTVAAGLPALSDRIARRIG